MLVGVLIRYYNEWRFTVDLANRLYTFKFKETNSDIMKRKEEIQNILDKEESTTQIVGANI